MKKELSRRSGVQITAELMKLLGGRLSAVMLLAVLNGSLGFLCAMGVPFFGAVGIAKALGESIPLSYGAIAGLCVGCGAVMPIADMVRATRRLAPLALFHTDAVQGFLKVPFKAKTLGADLISISGHKVHGPKGVGALYIKPGLPLPAFIHGGGQEGNFRSGTENVPGICGFGAAVAATDAAADIAKMARLRDLAREILPEVPGLVLIGAQEAPLQLFFHRRPDMRLP